MTRTMTKNAELTQQFNQYYPGAHTNFKARVDPDKIHLFQGRAEGSTFWDVDNNPYIDYMGGLGPNILGHRHPEYIAALKDHMDHQSMCVASNLVYSENDIVVAKKLVKHIPCAEKVKFNVTGTEAVQQALRLARGYTGRRYFLRFGGHYHGWADNILGGVIDPDPKGKPYPLFDTKGDGSGTLGRSSGAAHEGMMIPWNNIEILEETLARYGEEIAIIHLEALVCNNGMLYPRPGYLERIRELCDQYGIVMSFDEVITGFRVGLNGAQGLFGVTPDICTLGKSIGGGVPISAVVGKTEIMELLNGQVLGPGTFNGNAFCMRAMRATLEILERDNGAAYQTVDRIQQSLMAGLNEIARRRGVPLRIQGATGVFVTLFGLDPDTTCYSQADVANVDWDLCARFDKAIFEEGVAPIYPRWYMTLSHSDEDIARTLEAADRAMGHL